ncbi:MAG: DMT family transporter [Enterobacter sp.]|nr:DMT family transporter [Enterobacter sp.]
MISGVLYALLAGMMWGLIFVGPLIVPEYPAILQSTGRYLALGLIALPLAWLGRARLRQLSRQDWGTALALTMMGNLIYYVCLASAIQRTGAPVSTMIIGTLPVVIPVFANLLYSQRDGKLAWSKMAPALVCTALGLICVNIAELRHGQGDVDLWRYGSGILLAFISVACWAWYALRNARWLRENPDKHPMMWATAQALVTLPVSVVGYLGACLWLGHQQPDFAQPFGPRPWVFNIASQKLPTVILGPLIVFETLAGLLYTFLMRQSVPPLFTACGIVLLVVGVVMAVRAKPEKPRVVPASEV